MKKFPVLPVVAGLAAIGVLYAVTRPSSSGSGTGPDAPARNERDRVVQEAQALLKALEANPSSVTAAQLRTKAVELRRNNEPEFAALLENAANRLPA